MAQTSKPKLSFFCVDSAGTVREVPMAFERSMDYIKNKHKLLFNVDATDVIGERREGVVYPAASVPNAMEMIRAAGFITVLMLLFCGSVFAEGTEPFKDALKDAAKNETHMDRLIVGALAYVKKYPDALYKTWKGHIDDRVEQKIKDGAASEEAARISLIVDELQAHAELLKKGNPESMIDADLLRVSMWIRYAHDAGLKWARWRDYEGQVKAWADTLLKRTGNGEEKKVR